MGESICQIWGNFYCFGLIIELKDEVTTDTQFVLKELQPFRNYSVYVKVYSSQGAGGLDSDIVYAQTNEDGM